jgi:hypothetical protein
VSWLQPVAWIGIVALALPVLIHLLGLGRARRLPFPTLRFLQATRLLPTRRTKLHDPWLLLVRALIVLCAVAALAQPFWHTGARRAAYGSSLARVIVLDTSRSARLAAARSGWSADSARTLATQLLNDANAAILLETTQPDATLAGAIEWLQMQAQRQELVVVSDFQRGTLDQTHWSAIPPAMGVRLVRIGAGAASSTASSATTMALGFVRSAIGENDLTVRAAFGRDDEQLRTSATWTRAGLRGNGTAPAGETRVTLLSSTDDSALADALIKTAAPLSVRLVDSAAPDPGVGDQRGVPREIVVVTPSHAARASLRDSVAEVTAVWMMDVLAQVSRSTLLAEAASRAVLGDTIAPSSTDVALIPVARTDSGRVIVSAAAHSSDGAERLLLFTHVAIDDASTAALLVAAQQAVDATLHATSAELTDANVAESEVLAIPDSVLATWQRDPSSDGQAVLSDRAAPLEGPSDARWVWLAVLLLLGLETVLRRKISTTAPLAGAASSPAQAASDQAGLRT